MELKLVGVAFLEEAKIGAGLSHGKFKIPNAINKLGSCPVGSGHDNFLRQIRVMVDITAPQYWWLQCERYGFFNINMESKMHSLVNKMDIWDDRCIDVDTRVINVLEEYIKHYKDGDIEFEEVLAQVPMGLQLTARCETSYAQLKTMYNQRKTHKLYGWNSDFVKFCESLPEFKELTGCGLNN